MAKLATTQPPPTPQSVAAAPKQNPLAETFKPAKPKTRIARVPERLVDDGKPRWRVKHPALGSFVVTADTAKEAKELVFKEQFPGDSQDEVWLEQSIKTARVGRLPDRQPAAAVA